MFPTISFYAFDFIFGHAAHAGTSVKLAAQCTGSTPYTLAYTGLRSIDESLCPLVAFFHVMMEPPHSLPFNVELLTGLAALAIIPYIEAARQGRNILLECHWILGIIYQKFTGAVVLPIYWLLFVLTGAATLHRTPQTKGTGRIDQRHAESVVFALVAAYILPSIGMLVAHNDYVTAFWQAFPLWMCIAQRLYLAVRPLSQRSGVNIVNKIYMGLFFLSAIPHIYLLTPIVHNTPNPLNTLGALFIPSFTPLDPKSTTFDHGIQDIIQWDAALMVVSAFAATVWVVGPSVKNLAGLMAWWVCSTVLFGPGATIAGVFWCREASIEKQLVKGHQEKQQ